MGRLLIITGQKSQVTYEQFSKGSYAVTVFFDEKDKKVLTIIKQ